MNIFQQGGVMMWPLLFLSVPALAVVAERLLIFISSSFPSGDRLEKIMAPAKNGEAETAIAQADENCPAYASFFKAILSISGRKARENAANRAGQEKLFALGRRLDFLSTTATAAPLMGLLGTVLGMIQAFSRLASSGNAVDITILAGGIWQALLTTAAGLSVAIPALLAHRWFVRAQERTAFAMQSAANEIIDALEGPAKE